MNEATLNPALIMFDLDGTLIDTMGDLADLAALVIHETLGLTVQDARKRYLDSSGFPFRQQLELLFPQQPENDAMGQRFEREKGSIVAAASWPAAVVETLETLAAQGRPLVLSSNSAQHYVDQLVARGPAVFDLVLGFGGELAKGEPHVARTLARFGVERDEILFVGDSINDARLAKQTGLDFIGVLTTFTRRDFEAFAPSIKLLDDVTALPARLERRAL